MERLSKLKRILDLLTRWDLMRFCLSSTQLSEHEGAFLKMLGKLLAKACKGIFWSKMKRECITLNIATGLLSIETISKK